MVLLLCPVGNPMESRDLVFSLLLYTHTTGKELPLTSYSEVQAEGGGGEREKDSRWIRR